VPAGVSRNSLVASIAPLPPCATATSCDAVHY